MVSRPVASAPLRPLVSRQLLEVCRRSRQGVSQLLAEKTARPYNQLRVLQAIEDCGCSTQAELSGALCLDPAAISRLVDKLVDDKLVKRSEGADRRSVQLEATAAGRKELQILHDAQEELDARMVAGLSAAERKQLSALLSTVAASLEETDAPPQPQMPPRTRARALPRRRPTRSIHAG